MVSKGKATNRKKVLDQPEIDESLQKFQHEIVALREQIEKGLVIFNNDSNSNESVSNIKAMPKDCIPYDKIQQLNEQLHKHKTLRDEMQKIFTIIDRTVQDKTKQTNYKVNLFHEAVLRLDDNFNELWQKRQDEMRRLNPYVSDKKCEFGLLELLFSLTFLLIIGFVAFGNTVFYFYHSMTHS